MHWIDSTDWVKKEDDPDAPWYSLLGRFKEKDGSTRLQLNFIGMGDVIAFAYVIAAEKASNPGTKLIWDVLNKNLEWASIFKDADEVISHPMFRNSFLPGDARLYLQRAIIDNETRQVYLAKCLDVDTTLIRTPKFDTPPVHPMVVVPPVVIAPQSAQRLRMLPYKFWAELTSLFINKGIPVVILGTDLSTDDWPEGSFVYRASSPIDMLSLISSSLMVVSGDTGPAHVAGMLGVAATVLISVDRPAHVFGMYPSVHCITPPDKWSCSPCLRMRGRGCEDGCHAEGCFALADMNPHHIMEYIEMRLKVLKIDDLHVNARGLMK